MKLALAAIIVASLPAVATAQAAQTSARFELVSAPVNAQQEVVGATGHLAFTARANRPSSFSLRVFGLRSSDVVTDTSTAMEAVLRLPMARNGRAMFATGDYNVTVVAFDRASGEKVMQKWMLNVNVISPDGADIASFKAVLVFTSGGR
jgi:hypothetical protein